MSDEVLEIIRRYEERKTQEFKEYFYANAYTMFERELLYKKLIIEKFGVDLSKIKILEVGAGTGDNLLFFHRIGFKWENIYGNELLSDRGNHLKENLVKSENIFIGNALDLTWEYEFDIVFQSLVFTSVLDPEFRKKLAEKMVAMTKPSGIIIFYDFKYNNPSNKNVRGVSLKEIRRLFPQKRIESFSVTLAPPISRRIGRLYNLINFLFPFFRTHLVSVISY